MTDQPYDANDPDNPLNGDGSTTPPPTPDDVPADPATDGAPVEVDATTEDDNPIEGVPTPGPEGAPE